MINNRSGKGRFRRKPKHMGLASPKLSSKVVFSIMPIFSIAFMAAFLSSSIFAPMNASNATDSVVSANVTARAYTLSLTVSPNVELDLSASLSGAMTVGAAAVSIETNAPTGYKLYMNMTGTNADTSDLVQTDGSNTIFH